MKKKNYFEAIAGMIFILYFIASVALMFYYSKMENSGPYILMDFGQIALVFGVIAYLSQSKKVKFAKSENHGLDYKWFSLFIIVIGAVVLIGSYLYIKTSVVNSNNIGIIVALVGMTLFDIYSIGIVAVSIINNRKASNYKEIEAELIKRLNADTGVSTDSYTNLPDSYYLQFEFEYDGKKHIYEPLSACDYMEIGTKIKIRVNPDDVKEIIWEDYNNIQKSKGILFMIICLITTIGIILSMLI